MAVSFIAAGSRGPVLGLVVGLVVLLTLALRDRRSRTRVLLVAIAAIAGAVLVGQLVPGEDVQRSLSVLTGSGNGPIVERARLRCGTRPGTCFWRHPLSVSGTGAFARNRALSTSLPTTSSWEMGARGWGFSVVTRSRLVARLSGGLRALWAGGTSARLVLRIDKCCNSSASFDRSGLRECYRSRVT